MRSVFNNLSDVANTPVVKKITEKYNLSVEELIYLFRTGKVKDIKGIGEKIYSELCDALNDFLPEFDTWHIDLCHDICGDKDRFSAFFDNEAYELFFKNYPDFSKIIEESLDNLNEPVKLKGKGLAHFSYGDILRARFQEQLSIKAIGKKFEISDNHTIGKITVIVGKAIGKSISIDDWKRLSKYGFFCHGYTPETLFLELCDMRMAGIDPFYWCWGEGYRESNKKIGEFLQQRNRLEKVKYNIWHYCRFPPDDYMAYYFYLVEKAKELNPTLFSPKFNPGEEYSLIFRNRDVDDDDYIRCQNHSSYPPSIKIEDLDLSVHSYNCLKRNMINTLKDIIKLSRDELSGFRNLGVKSVDEIIAKVESMGYELRKD